MGKAFILFMFNQKKQKHVLGCSIKVVITIFKMVKKVVKWLKIFNFFKKKEFKINLSYHRSYK